MSLLICSFSLLANLSLALSLLSRMCVLLFVCPICCLLTSHNLSLLTRKWVLSLVCPVYYLHISFHCCASAYQDVSDTSHLSTACLPLSLLARMWVPLACPVHHLLISLSLYLCLLGYECCPLFIPYATCWPLSYFISVSQDVSVVPHSFHSLSADLFLAPDCECYPSSISFHYLLISLSLSVYFSGCKCYSLFYFLTSHSASA